MFKAKNTTTKEDIIILDTKWIGRVKYLRLLDRGNMLVCPGCEQPVRVRAGRTRRWHFAHKHLLNCSYGYESPAVLNARAVLYRWLVSKFGEGVRIEKDIDAGLLPRHIDCWVETEKGNFAYWIIGSRMKPQKRDDIWAGFSKLKVSVNWIFVIDMLREDDFHSDSIHLTTTEREFACQTDFDEIRIANEFVTGNSLHYLDPTNETIITYRGLRIIHAPQLYRGRKIENELASVLVSPVSGEFVHPGEHEQLELRRQEKIQLENEQRERESKITEFHEHLVSIKSLQEYSLSPKVQPQHERQEQYLTREVKVVCILCGQITADYWYLNRADNTCKCRECYQQGRY